MRDYQHVFWLAALAIALSVGWFLLDGDVRLNLADEGLLWYGTQAVRLGLVPVRDFQSYDPGRYFWTAAWSFCLGQGVLSLRLSCVFFQCLGVIAGLLAARRLSKNWLFLICIAVLLCAWMHPRYKVFEQSIALMAVYAGVLLLERPSARRHWWVGVFGGVAAFIGCNHGAYHVLAFGLLIAWAARADGWRTWLRRTLVWGAGLLAGYTPQWLLFIFAPGYFREFVRYLKAIVSNGTNLVMPIPWPWLVPKVYPLWLYIAGIVEGCFYLAIPIFFALVALRALQSRQKKVSLHPVLIAAACVSLPYTHYVFSRPDIVHLSHGMPTVALGTIAVGFSFGGRWRRLGHVLPALLLVASVTANLYWIGITFKLLAPPKSLIAVEVKGERMLLTEYQYRVLASAHHLAHDLAKPDEPILFLPLMPGLYPFTGRLSPVKRIYFVFPSPEEDRALLAEIEAARVEWVMLQDYALDDRDDLRFRNTNPMVFEYFRKNFGAVPIATLPSDQVVLHRRRMNSNP